MDHTLLVVAAVGSAFTAVVTAVYAYFTYRILQASRDVVSLTERQLLAANRPFVTIRAATRPASQIFQLSIASTGNTAAKNLRLSISPDFHRFAESSEDNSLQALHMFREKIDSFPPKMELDLDLGVSWELYNDDTQSISPLVFTVCAEYDGQAEHYWSKRL